jgi:hypothetical protein
MLTLLRLIFELANQFTKNTSINLLVARSKSVMWCAAVPGGARRGSSIHWRRYSGGATQRLQPRPLPGPGLPWGQAGQYYVKAALGPSECCIIFVKYDTTILGNSTF